MSMFKPLSSSRLTLAAWAGSLLVLAACSSTPEKPKPAALESLPASATGTRPVWSQRVGSVDFAQRLAVVDGVVVAASTDGHIGAWDMQSGRPRWTASADTRLSAGVGSDGRYASVVSRDNELYTFDAGKLVWHVTLSSRVVTPPLVAGERVFVQGIDRAIHAFDAMDGHKLWTFQRTGDPLTLLQPGLLQPVGNTLWAGVGTRLVGIDPLTGVARQDIVIALPRGTNEVERLADIVGPAGRVDSMLCVRSFQTAVGCAQVSALNPTLRWSRPQTGAEGVAADQGLVVGADANDRVLAWRFGSGDVAWRSERLIYRGLTSPALFTRALAIGDREGYVHLLARDDGRTLARMSTDGSGFAAPPLASSGWLFTLTRSGQLDAWHID